MSQSNDNSEVKFYYTPARLPVWNVVQAMNIAYTEAMVRMANSINLKEFVALHQYRYKLYLIDEETEEEEFIVYKGLDAPEPAILPFNTTISLFAMLRYKSVKSTFLTPEILNIAISDEGALDRTRTLLMEREEFGYLDLHTTTIGQLKLDKGGETNVG